MRIPTPCGPVSRAVHDHLESGTPLPELPDAPDPTSRDHALALWTLHELAYRGFDGVDPDLEWSPDVLRVRNRLSRDLEAWLRRRFAEATVPGQCFLLPRLRPAAKAALTELQYDELGDGEPDLVHQHLFAQALEAAGLDPGYGAYVDDADEETLTLNNAISLLCLNRRLVHAALGHLAAFEATSALPSADMVRGLQRLGFAEPVWRYYDEHVEADAVHEHLARRICDLATEGDPALEREVLFGAFVCVDLEDRCAERLVPTAVPA